MLAICELSFAFIFHCTDTCGGIWYQKDEQKCHYVTDPSIGVTDDAWSACYTLHRSNANANANGYTNANANANTDNTNSVTEVAPPPATVVVTKPTDPDSGVCPRGCLKDSTTCEDYLKYYSCSVLETKVSWCSCAFERLCI